jgi:phage-related protein
MSRSLAAAIAQAEFENNVNEMAKLLETTGKDNGKPPAGWRVAYTYKEGGHDKNKVFVNDKTKQVVLAYGGTQPRVSDWAKNFDAGKTSLKINGKDYGNVHSGFYKQFQRTETNMFGAADQYLKSGYKLEIAGHSQGGAAATIASAYAKEKYGVANPKVVTFGSPSVGDKQFANMYNSRVNDNTRVVNSYTNMFGQKKTEVVPSVPLPGMGYQHVGKLKSVTTGRGDFTQKLGNHLMDNYERATRNNPDLDKHGLIVRTIGKGVNAAKNGIVKGVKKVGEFGKNVGSKVRNTARNVGNKVRNTARNVGNKVRNTARNVGNKVRSTVRNVGNKVRNTARNVGNKVRNTARNVGNRVRNTARNVGNRVRNTARNVGNRVRNTARNVGNKVRSTARNVGNRVRSTARNVGNKVRSTARNVGNKVRSTARNVSNKVKSTARNVGNKVRSTARNVGNKVRSTARNVSNRARSTARNVGNKVRSTARNVSNKVKSTARNVGSKVRSTASRVSSGVRSVASRARSAVSSGVSRAKSAVSSSVSRAKSAVSSSVSRARSAVSSVKSSVSSAARSVGSRISGALGRFA